jgi:serine/threonine-protein kinase
LRAVRRCVQCDLRDHDDDHTRCLVCGGLLEACPDPRVGTVLGGRYRIEAVIGEGGMATVYRARHALMQRPYAVKVLHRDLARDERLVERMRREARSTAALTHPNIVEIYDFGMTDDGAPYLVMELLEGVPLRAMLKGAPLPFAELVELAVQMAEGLARAHDFGVVHRDLKPENVFVCDDAGHPLVKIVDFGIARSEHESRLTNMGEVVGTPQYMAPERALSREVTPACDLYSLGVVLYEMATGALPFQSNSATGFVLKHLHEAPRRPSQVDPSVSPALEALILELLEKDPSRRPVDAHQVIERLRALAPASSLVGMRPSRPAVMSPVEHTATLDGWLERASLLERLIERAHPQGRAPTPTLELLNEIRASIVRMRALRDEGVRAQRELDALALESRDGSERLGHAVHVLAKDLSRAREEARSAQTEAKDRAESAAALKRVFHGALADLVQTSPMSVEHPTDAIVTACVALGDAAQAWQRADDAATRSSARAERSEAEVRDLDFQVEELRKQLAKLEATLAERGAASRAVLERNGAERARCETRLSELTRRIVGPLRSEAAVQDLVRALDAPGAPA